MSIAQVVFFVLGFVVLASALTVAASKNLVRSIFMFFVTLFALAGLYVFALADFVAITQVVIYVGGVLVLMLFAFMLTSRDVLNNLQKSDSRFTSFQKIPAFLVAVLFLLILINAIIKAEPGTLGWIQASAQNNNIIQPTDNMVPNIGISLMTRYLLPFEAVSVLLMMALIGAAHLARKEEHKF
jgi:NADH:ubiquinone oxidoreductase subunit 6 (subunit J)